MYLRDRVAAVSNRVGEVTNGEPLEVLEHGRRFLRVKTAKNEIGWIPDRAVIDVTTYDAFVALAGQHKTDPVIANGAIRDDIYLHISPGRDSDRFFLLPGNDKVEMLERASVAKNAAPAPRPPAPHHEAGKNAKGVTPVSIQHPPSNKPEIAKPEVAKPEAPKPEVAKPEAVKPEIPETEAAEAPPASDVPLEDWWLVRDASGRAGWVLGSRVDVDVPDDVAQYAEGQRIVGAYVLAKVHDDQAPSAHHEVSEYVTALAPPKAGLPYDFDQIRVFTWSLKHHRYETAFRLHPIQGFLPVRIGTDPDPKGPEPSFSFQISSSADLVVDPSTGIAHPVAPRTINYAMRDTSVHRIGPDLAPIPYMHQPGDKEKKDKKSKSAKAKSSKTKKRR